MGEEMTIEATVKLVRMMHPERLGVPADAVYELWYIDEVRDHAGQVGLLMPPDARPISLYRWVREEKEATQ